MSQLNCTAQPRQSPSVACTVALRVGPCEDISCEAGTGAVRMAAATCLHIDRPFAQAWLAVDCSEGDASKCFYPSFTPGEPPAGSAYALQATDDGVVLQPAGGAVGGAVAPATGAACARVVEVLPSTQVAYGVCEGTQVFRTLDDPYAVAPPMCPHEPGPRASACDCTGPTAAVGAAAVAVHAATLFAVLRRARHVAGAGRARGRRAAPTHVSVCGAGA